MNGSTTKLKIEPMPPAWFDRSPYTPRLTAAGRSVWFLLHPTFAPADRVPDDVPHEPEAGRPALRNAFEDTYRAWTLPRTAETERALAWVGEPGTAVVVAGQQPGFLGGPLLTIYKALSAVAAARRYRAMTGRPCVPVFWVAGEDHDLDEVREARFPGPEGGAVSFRLPHVMDRRPLSDYPMDAEACVVLEAAAAHLAARRHGSLARALVDLHRGRGLAAGFAAILCSLLGDTGILVVDPARLRPLAASLFRKVIDRPEEVLACVERGRRDVKSHGIEPFVAGRLPLFIITDGKRHHLSLHPQGLQVDGGGPALSRDTLLRLHHQDPGSFSAGALFRPLVQQSVLPCVLTVGGPAEIGYYAQIGPLSTYLGVPRPRIGLRLNATIVDGKLARTSASLPRDILARSTSPEDLVPRGEEPRSLSELRELARRLEMVLPAALTGISGTPEESRLARRAGEIPDTIRGFIERIEKVHARQKTDEIAAARRLWSFILPDGELQERAWNVLHFVARHGTGWLERIIADLEPDPLRVVHRWISFDEDEPA